MNITRFKQNLIPLLTSSEGDGPFQYFRMMSKGMASVRTAKLLNFACLCAGEGDMYVEIGTYSGFTIVSAAFQNNTLCIGIDDFSAKDILKNSGSEEIKSFVRGSLKNVLAQHNYGNIQIIEADFRDVKLPENARGKIAIFFIDGEHDYKNVHEAISNFEPFLSDEAIVVFDDVTIRDIPKKIKELWQGNHYDLLFYGCHELDETEKTKHMGMPLNPVVANGIAVMHFHRN